MAKTKIEWTDQVWNPITGCTKVSPGCANCYAERFAKRLAGRCGYPADEPFRVTLHEERLLDPYTWKKPRKVFVCSMSDLFHEDVPDEYVYRVFLTMDQNPQHTYLILTKRPERLLRWNNMRKPWPGGWPIYLWFGVTAENQDAADKRIPILLQIPAAVRFVSVEPMLGPVDLTRINQSNNAWINGLTGDWTGYHHYGGARTIKESWLHLDWVICGSETGPNARPIQLDWIRSLRDQCISAGVPFFLKQLPSVDGKRTVKMPELDCKAWGETP